MAGSFPTEFPANALQAILRPVLGGAGFTGEVALGAYDLVGFGLYQMFGDVQYAMAGELDTPEKVSNMVAQAPPEIQKAIACIQSNPELLEAETMPAWAFPALQYLIQFALTKLFERLAKQDKPMLFGKPVMMAPPPKVKEKEKEKPKPLGANMIPAQTGGAFPASPAQPNKPPAPTDPKPSGGERAGAPASQPGGPVGPVTNAPGITGTPGTTNPPVAPKAPGSSVHPVNPPK